jgi:hypothetical protein
MFRYTTYKWSHYMHFTQLQAKNIECFVLLARVQAYISRVDKLDPTMSRLHLRHEQMLSVSVEVPGEGVYQLQPCLCGI